jgi:immune inhibitor A
LRSIVHVIVLLCLLIPAGAAGGPTPPTPTVPASSDEGMPDLQLMPPHPRLKAAIERGDVNPPGAVASIAQTPGIGVDQPRGGQIPLANPLQGESASLNALAVVIDFSDKVKTVQASFFDSLIFAPPVGGRGSVRDYFREVSYSTIDVVTVNLPSSLGWKRAPQTYGYYVNNNYCTDGIYPNNCQKLAEDIVDAINGVVNFSNYDNDGDGYAEPIMLIHAGPGAEFTGSPTDVWSHSWVLDTAKFYDNVWIADYVIMPEYWQAVSAATSDMTIGVFAHEMGHGFWGLPDLYDRDYSSEGAGNWSLMAGGSWNGPNTGGWGPNGSSPAWPDAWSRTKMGFSTATPIGGNVVSLFIPRAYGNPPPAQTVLKLRSAVLGAQEYFLLENRQQLSGSYDEWLPGSGLLVWHVDEAMNVYGKQNDYECTSVPHCVCSDSYHYLLALEQADGLLDLERALDGGDTGDPFPGNTFNRTWTMLTNPESSSWYGSGTCTNTCIGVTNIGNSGATMAADLRVTCGPMPDDWIYLPIVIKE